MSVVLSQLRNEALGLWFGHRVTIPAGQRKMGGVLIDIARFFLFTKARNDCSGVKLLSD